MYKSLSMFLKLKSYQMLNNLTEFMINSSNPEELLEGITPGIFEINIDHYKFPILSINYIKDLHFEIKIDISNLTDEEMEKCKNYLCSKNYDKYNRHIKDLSTGKLLNLMERHKHHDNLNIETSNFNNDLNPLENDINNLLLEIVDKVSHLDMNTTELENFKFHLRSCQSMIWMRSVRRNTLSFKSI